MIVLSIAIPLLVMGLVAVLNLFFYRKLSHNPPQKPPHISILIPARNEAQTLNMSLTAVLAQRYPSYEVLLLNDQSSDQTKQIALEIGRNHTNFHLLDGATLPHGWLGKNWACHQLAQAATGDILIFTDADVVWQANALSAIVRAFEKDSADMVTVWPTQITKSWPERLIVPLIGHAVLAYLPIAAVHHTNLPIFAAANGQCLAIRKAAYDQIGGHRQVRSNVVEDVALAQAVKRAKRKLRLYDGNHFIRCRMYEDWPTVRDGFAKNILGGHQNSVPLLLFSTFFHLWVFVMPWLWLLHNMVRGDGGLQPLLLGLSGLVIRAISGVRTNQRWQDAILMPLSVLMMTVIALKSLYWHSTQQAEWKGRKLKSSRV